MTLMTELPGHYESDVDVHCDKCQAPSIHDNIFFFSCIECGDAEPYDLCGNCVGDSCLPKPRCVVGHKMAKLSNYEYPVTEMNPEPSPPSCDVCKTHDLPNVYSFFYHCEPCMHDLCPLCGIIASPQGETAAKPADVKYHHSVKPVVARLHLLQMLNKSIEKTLPYVDLGMASRPGSVAHLFSRFTYFSILRMKRNEMLITLFY